MSSLSAVNTKFTSEELSKISGLSSDTLATWGLKNATDSLTLSQLAERAASDEQAKAVLDKIISQNAQILSNTKIIASEKGAALATGSFTTAIKANIAALKAWLISNPIGQITLLATTIFAAVKLIDLFTTSLKEQKEKMEESISTYEDAKSNLNSITSELKSQSQAMDELLKKDALTYAEKGQLEELQKITQELRIQKDLAEKDVASSRENAAIEAAKLYQKQFGSQNISEDAVNSSLNNPYFHPSSNDTNNLSETIAAYEKISQALQDAYDAGDQSSIDEWANSEKIYREAIFSTAIELQNEQDAISDYYDTIKNIPYDSLTSDQKMVVDSFNGISEAIELIYRHLDPNTWNSIKIDDIFSVEGLEVTKEELIDMAKEGTLDEGVIRSYKKLNSALEESNLVLEDGQTAAAALNDEIHALAKEEGNLSTVGAKTASFSDIFSLEDAEGELNTLGKISESIDTIQNAYKTLNDAIDEYNQNGTLSIDTLQSVISLGDGWLDYLVDENGNLKLDKESLEQLTLARLNDMRVQTINNLIDNVSKIKTDADANEYLKTTNYALADSYEAVAQASLRSAKAKLDDAVASGTLSRANANSVWAKTNADISKINKLFTNTSISMPSITGSSGSSSSGSSKTTDSYEEVYDFFEDRIDRLNEKYQLLETNIENVSGAVAKNKLVDAQYDIAAEKLNNYTDALDMYKQKANEALASIPADMVNDVVKGAVKITDFIGSGNKDVVDAVKNYNDWADKISDVTNEISELQKEMRQLELSKFNNIIDQYTDMFDIRGNVSDNIQKQIDLLEAAGEMVGDAYYESLIQQTAKQIEILNQEKADLSKQLASALSTNRIQAGTDEWLEMVSALGEVDGKILDAKTSLEEFDNELLQLHYDTLDRITDSFSDISDELENIADLMDGDVALTDGTWTESGLTQLGMYAQQYELARHEVEMYQKEIEYLEEAYLNGKYSATEYADKLSELNDLQWDAVKAAEDAKQSIMDLNETRVDIIIDGINEEIDAYKELTQAKIDELEAEKELSDYRDELAEKTKNVADLEKQIEAMSNDTSASTRAQIAKLREQLAEAKKDLADTEQDHAYDIQVDDLNKAIDDFTKIKEEEIKTWEDYVKQTEQVIYDSFEAVKQNAATISAQLEQIVKNHGITISSTITTSWQAGETAIASYGQTLSIQSSSFISNIIGVQNQVNSLRNQANLTASSMASMFNASADRLVGELGRSYSSVSNVNKMMQTLRQTAIDTLERGYNVNSIVNALSQVSGALTNSANAWNKYTNALQSGANSIPATVGGKGSTSSLPNRAYASGTKNAKSGWAKVFEQGEELELTKIGNNTYQFMEGGEQVIPAEGTERLWKYSQIDPEDLIRKVSNNRATFSPAAMLTQIPTSAPKNITSTLQIGTLLSVGDIDSNNLKKVEKIAKDAVNSGFKQFSDEIRKNGGYR